MRLPIRQLLPLLVVLAGCDSAPGDGGERGRAGGLVVVREDPAHGPLRTVSPEQLRLFNTGDAAFALHFREPDGLGPLYIRASCESCHQDGGRGPGAVQKLAVVTRDGGIPVADSVALPHGNTVRPFVSAGAIRPLLSAEGELGEGEALKITTRAAPGVIGRGYIEAIADAEIERVEAEQAARTDGIHGRINRVAYRSQPNPDTAFHRHQPGDSGLIGRFGLKARIATLDEFAADALQGDMGMTSPLRPDELPNPEGLVDDARPGVDVSAELVNQLAGYMRLLELPGRDRAQQGGAGPALFEEALCSVCHTPSLKTRADYPVAQLAGIDAPVYTDLLLHDMGSAGSDGIVDEQAKPSEWRTAPLIGLRFMKTFLHDGRARSVRDAVLKHQGPGSQANVSVEKFNSLSPDRQQALLEFVGSL